MKKEALTHEWSEGPSYIDLYIEKISQEQWKEQNLTILINRSGHGREIRDQVLPVVGF